MSPENVWTIGLRRKAEPIPESDVAGYQEREGSCVEYGGVMAVKTGNKHGQHWIERLRAVLCEEVEI